VRTEDGHIIDKCLNGDSAAFGLLVDKYKGGVYALAYSKLGNFHDAEDVAQDVFIKAYQKLRTLRRWDNFLAWLYAITSNRCKMLIRERSRRPDQEFIGDRDFAPSTSSYHESLVRESLYDALDSLPEIYRQVVTLYYLGGMSGKEIAQFLGTPPATVRQRLTRARSQLKEEMVVMMSTTFEEQKLQVSFTFRIVEAVKRIKIQSIPRTAGLPWGLSLATGIIIAVLGISPHVSFLNPMVAHMSSALPSEARAMETGEIPVHILKISRMPVLASKQGDSDNGVPKLPEPPKTAPMAAHGEGDTWTTKSDMPTARSALSTSVVNGKIYALGGETNAQPLSTVEEYDPATDTWTVKPNMPTARYALSTSVVNGKIYAIGGALNPNTSLPTVEEYDPATDTWTKKSDMPMAIQWLSTSAVNGKIYVIGGIAGGSTTLSTMEEYDPATDTWTKKTNMPTARGVLSTSVVNGKIYAIGGWKGGASLSIVEEYDPRTNTWTTKAHMPTRRQALSTSVVNGKIYTIGGGRGVIPLSTVEEYDPATDTWTTKADMPMAKLISLSTSAVNGKIYAIGGSLTDWPWTAVSTVEEYDTGFVPEESSSAGPKGKLVKTWGEIKSD